MQPFSEQSNDFKTRWQSWLAEQRLPVAAATEFDEQNSTWRHPALPGVFSSNWRFKQLDQPSELPPSIFWTRDLTRLAGEYMCVVSSRVGRQIDAIPNWINALRTVVCKAYSDGKALATAEGTATHPFVQRLAAQLRIPRVVLRPFDFRQETPFPERVALANGCEIDIYYSLLPQRALVEESTIDGWLIGFADQVRVLAVNSMRNTFRGTMARLKSGSRGGDVWILHEDQLSKPSLRGELLKHGAVDWLLAAENKGLECSLSEQRFPLASTRLDHHEFLAHCTRAPMIDARQSSAVDEIDRLLFRQNIEGAGTLTSLIRILTSGRLQASRDLIRGGEPMVCWTAQPVSRISELRTYRKHLARWDFEPFGIAARRKRLKALGIRQVRYGAASELATYDLTEQSFFQLAASQIGGQLVDWTREQEWRLPGDLPLASLSVDDAFVFVPDQQSAELVAPYSRWPVLLTG